MGTKQGAHPELEEFFPTGPERIQKLLARAGYGSRRKCEELIQAKRVKVDGRTVTEMGSKADPKTQVIEVDNKVIRPEELVYYILNKPKNVLCTVDDPLGRKTVLSFFPNEVRRIFPVGRLDLDSRGAVILTNDGRLTQLLTHPRYGIDRTYTVRVRGNVDDYDLNRLRSGIQLSEGRTSPAKVWIAKRRDDETELGVTIHEGRNRQVRRMFAAVDHKVRALTRTRIGGMTIKGLAAGEARRISRQEIKALIGMAKTNSKNPNPNPPRKGPRKRHGKPDPALAHQFALAKEQRRAREALVDPEVIEVSQEVEQTPSSNGTTNHNSRYKGHSSGPKKGRRGRAGGGVPSRRGKFRRQQQEERKSGKKDSRSRRSREENSRGRGRSKFRRGDFRESTK